MDCMFSGDTNVNSKEVENAQCCIILTLSEDCTSVNYCNVTYSRLNSQITTNSFGRKDSLTSQLTSNSVKRLGSPPNRFFYLRCQCRHIP